MPNLGWASDKEDIQYLRQQAAKYQVYGAGDAPIAASFDPRTIIRVEDQGPMSSCTGHGGSSCLEACVYIDTSGTEKNTQFSRMFAYLTAQKQSGIKGDSGATITGLVEGFKRVGCCQESLFPYPSRYTNRIPNEAQQGAGQYKIVNHTYLTTYQEVWDWISRGMGPVVIGITWHQELANNSGVIETRDLSGGSLGGHCVFLWGWSERLDNAGRRYLWLGNSHGVGWGLRGWAEVAPNVVDAWGNNRNTEMIGVSDLTSFDKPRKLVGDWGRIV